jgi:hypothetical protein
MSNFATLATLVAACVVRVKPDACSSLFQAAAPPRGNPPSDTMAALQAVAQYPAYKPERLFALLDAFYPVPEGKRLRATPFLP